jgi:Polyketide cyclase / dehydrase and lipid transport
MKKVIKIVAIVALLAVVALLLFSPFQKYPDYAFRSIRHSVVIEAPVDSVYAYLSNSANAAHWSVFVDHITPLNPEVVPDGVVGSLRRCFQRADEQGLRWDEEIIIQEPLKRRRLSIFNLVDFPLEAEHLATDQVYEPLAATRTKVTFTVFFLKKPGIWTMAKTFVAAWKIRDIFQQNMNNIKDNLEQQRF